MAKRKEGEGAAARLPGEGLFRLGFGEGAGGGGLEAGPPARSLWHGRLESSSSFFIKPFSCFIFLFVLKPFPK
jgi:hypothetical protein